MPVFVWPPAAAGIPSLSSTVSAMPIHATGLLEHPVALDGLAADDIGIEHHERQTAVTFQRLSSWKSMMACFSQPASHRRGGSARCAR